MKKLLSVLLSVWLCAFSFSAAAAENHWYFVSKGQNERPRLPTVHSDAAKGIGNDEKVLFLTFDAGYENGNVKKIADILKEKNVTGAFFVLKHFVDKNASLCRELHESGNLVCNHTSSHPNITTLSRDELLRELHDVEEAYQKETGFVMDKYFRPPEGAWSEDSLETVKEAGYKTVFWSLAWADWDNKNQKSPEFAIEKLTTRVHNGAVILLHPTSETNVKILGGLIDRWKNEGYRFGSLNELWENE